MLNNSLDADLAHLSYDPDLAAKIMRRRQRERDRSSNLLTPRIRQAGLDISALDAQVRAKRAAAEAQRGQDEQYQLAMMLKGKIVGTAESLLHAEATAKQKECVEFSLASLKKEQRREFHLSDPRALRKELPPFADGSPPSISSMQKFEGEDPASPDKMREKRQAQASWLLAQMAEKKLRDQAEKDMDRRDDAALIEANNLRHACEAAEMQEMRQDLLDTARENQQMASARSAKNQAVREKETASTLEHIKNESEHNLMRERHDYSIGLNGKKRDYKRSSEEEEKRAWDFNRALVQSKIDQRRAQSNADEGYRKVGLAVDAIGKTAEEEYWKGKVRQRQKLDDANKALALEQKEQAAQEKEIYKCFASP